MNQWSAAERKAKANALLEKGQVDTTTSEPRYHKGLSPFSRYMNVSRGKALTILCVSMLTEMTESSRSRI